MAAEPGTFAQGSVGVSQAGVNGSAIGPTPPTFVVAPPQSVQLNDLPPRPSMLQIERDFDGANDTRQIAEDAVNNAQNYIGALADLATNLTPPVIEPDFPSLGNAPSISTPVAPALTVAAYNAPQLPSAFAGQVPGINSFPQFNAPPPSLTFPNAPAIPNPTLPPVPGIDLNFVYPTVQVTLPPVPSLLSIDVQKFDGVTFPTLTATAPVLTAVAPRLTDYTPNAPYTDALLQELKTTLQQRLDIGNTGTNTGLPPAVETNIWNREREREYVQQRDAIAALEKMEAMGYAFPPGTFIDAQIKIQTETNAVLVGSSRDIAVAQAKLEQDNIKMALEQSVAIEGKLIDYANETEQRRFEAAKYATEAGVSIYNSQVQAYEAMVSSYRAAIDVFNAQIAGAKAQVDIYSALIAAEKLKVDVNTSLVEQYKVEVDAALASIEVFKGEIDLIKVQAEIEQLKVSIFGEEVRAYAAQAQFYQATVEGYKATIEAEGSKEQVYATSAKVYETLVDATAKQIDAQVAIYNAQLGAKRLEYEGFTALVQSEAEKVRAIAAQNTSTAALYSAEVQGISSYNQALIEEYKASVGIAEQIAQLGVSAAEANGKLYIAAAGIATDSAKVGAQVEAQIAASALGAVTYATHRARQDSVGFSTSLGFSQSQSLGQSSSSSSGQSTSVSYGVSTSMSTSVQGGSTYSNNTNIAEAQ